MNLLFSGGMNADLKSASFSAYSSPWMTAFSKRVRSASVMFSIVQQKCNTLKCLQRKGKISKTDYPAPSRISLVDRSRLPLLRIDNPHGCDERTKSITIDYKTGLMFTVFRFIGKSMEVYSLLECLQIACRCCKDVVRLGNSCRNY